jgi:hypothetical protein
MWLRRSSSVGGVMKLTLFLLCNTKFKKKALTSQQTINHRIESKNSKCKNNSGHLKLNSATRTKKCNALTIGVMRDLLVVSSSIITSEKR